MRMFYQLMNVVTLKGVEQIEEILAVGHATLGHFRREVSHELLVCLHHGPELDY